MSVRRSISNHLRCFGVLLLVAACGEAPAGAHPEPQGSTGAALREDESMSASAALPADCERFLDVATRETPEISIRNTGSTPLFVVATQSGCSSTTSPSLVQVRRGGQLLEFEPSSCRGASCARYMSTTEPPLQDKRGGCSCGGWSSLQLLEPQQVLKQSAELELTPVELPGHCFGDASFFSISCVVRVLPAPGNYTIEVRAFTELACEPLRDAGRADDPDAHCGCLPDSSGRCTNPYIQRTVFSPALTFSLPTSNYFQAQEIEISAP